MSNKLPRGPSTAYALYVKECRKIQESTRPDENIVFLQFLTDCKQKWEVMPEQDKARFCAMAEEDRKRYDAEMQNVPSLANKKRKTYNHIPEGPRRPLSAFYWFCNGTRESVTTAHPEWGLGEVARELGRLWIAADRMVKRKYEEIADSDIRRYMEETAVCQQKKSNTSECRQNEDEAIDVEEDYA